MASYCDCDLVSFASSKHETRILASSKDHHRHLYNMFSLGCIAAECHVESAAPSWRSLLCGQLKLELPDLCVPKKSPEREMSWRNDAWLLEQFPDATTSHDGYDTLEPASLYPETVNV